MDLGDDKFWHVLAESSFTDDESAEKFRRRLTKLGPQAVRRFDKCLQECLEALESEAFEASAGSLADDGTGLPIAGTALEYLRLSVVAAGRMRFESIVGDHRAVEGSWDLLAGERLEEAVGDAVAEAEDELSELVEPVEGYEGGDRPVPLRVSMGWGMVDDSYERYGERVDLSAEVKGSVRAFLATARALTLLRALACSEVWVILTYVDPHFGSEEVTLRMRRGQAEISISRLGTRLTASDDPTVVGEVVEREAVEAVHDVERVLEERVHRAAVKSRPR